MSSHDSRDQGKPSRKERRETERRARKAANRAARAAAEDTANLGEAELSTNPAPPAASPRYAHVQRLLDDEPATKAWALGLVDQLRTQSYCIDDNFLGKELGIQLAVEVLKPTNTNPSLTRQWFRLLTVVLVLKTDAAIWELFWSKVKKAYMAGELKSGMLAGGRSGKNKKYALERIRGDKVGWFDGDPCHNPRSDRVEAPLAETDAQTEGRCWQGKTLKVLMGRIGTLIQLIASQVPELQGIESRSEAMVTCYPGNGSRYIKHSDNPHRNGRKLTVLYYLNHGWKQDDGGELRIYADDNATVKEDVSPIGDRVVVFFSDTRVPHEVLPANTERFAITHWFYDHSERAKAETSAANAELDSSAGFDTDLLIEQRRIEAEIAKFEETSGEAATVKPAAIPFLQNGASMRDTGGAELEAQPQKSNLKKKKKKRKKKKPNDAGAVTSLEDGGDQEVGAELPDKTGPSDEVTAARAEAAAAWAIAETAVMTAEQAQSALKLAEEEAKATAAAASVAQIVAADAIAKADAAAAARDTAEAIRAKVAAVAAEALLKCEHARALATQKAASVKAAEVEQTKHRRKAAAARIAAVDEAPRAAQAKARVQPPATRPALASSAKPQLATVTSPVGSPGFTEQRYEPSQHVSPEPSHNAESAQPATPVEPRWEMNQPANMSGTTVVKAWLPGLMTARDIVLDVNTTWATLDTVDKSTTPYHLRVGFKSPIDVDRVVARFKKKAGVFVLTLPHANG